MQPKDMNGKELAHKIKENLQHRIDAFNEENGFSPKLAIVYVGEDPAAATYIKSKQKTCKKMKIETELFHFPAATSLEDLRVELKKLNSDRSIHGIIIELPLPAHIPFFEAVAEIDPEKDVDGLHPANLGWLFAGNPFYIPNTPMAVMKLIEEYKIDLKGKEVVIIGRSLAVGKPLIALMISKNATVTVCHTKTKDLSYHCLRADIIVVAAGKAHLLKGDMVKEGAVVIDVGINVTDEGLMGDVDYNDVYPKASLITPVPGGVGPITVTMIIENTLEAAILQAGKKHLPSNILSLSGNNSGNNG
ncbi:MAG: bifunctional 5,10-methylenetetrahydrofolate dehydrogenase/5,10-methenyltetrahydrofolate cyclohydrolase [Firmicutes bacterium]|nr:bifunctional 5,10-methylenetetrahydrofolate dehydrogenase/5,10-methenyltetrahydrofolate cyclohydrolase [Bacillota bacterium]